MPSNPKALFLLKSPLLWGGLLRFLRSPKSFATVFVFLGGLLFVVSQNWNFFVSHWAPGSDIAMGARQLFYSLSLGHLLLIIAGAPFLMAPAIAGERETGALDLLLSSPISIAHIVLAKLLGPLLFMAIILVSAAPVLSLCFLGGGLDAGEVARVYVVLFLAAVQFGCLGLFCSTLRPRVYEVYLVAAAMVLLFALFLPHHGSVWGYLSTFQWLQDLETNHGLQYLGPFFALQNEFSPPPGLRGVPSFIPDPFATMYTGQTQYFGYALGLYILNALGLGALFLLAAGVQLKRVSLGATGAVRQAPPEEDDEPAIDYGREGVVAFAETSQEGNPGLVLERRIQWFAKLPVLIRLFYASLMVSIITLPLASYNGSWLFLTLPFVVAALFTLPLSATSISSDRERGLLDLMRTTLLSPRQIVRAKFSANLRYSFLIALALYLPGMALQLVCGYMGYEVDLVTDAKSAAAVGAYPVILFFSLVAYTAFGLFCSAAAGHTNQALAVSGTVILSTLALPFLFPAPPSPSESPAWYGLTLLLSMMSPLVGVTALYPRDNVSLASHHLLLIEGEPLLFPLLFAAAQCALCAAAAALLLRAAERRLEWMD